MNNNISAINKKDCTGCLSCYNSCNHNAISVITDDEGFYRPIIAYDNCKNCGLCLKNCPLSKQRQLIKKDNYSFPEIYAFINSDESIRLNSSSGGFFSALAKYIIESNGVVFGANFDDDFNIQSSSFSEIADLIKFQGSKYAQSFIGHTYSECKAELDSGRLILFSGTPCQIEGLLSYLGKNYENLITVDIICHGVPSPKMWRNYILYKKKQYKADVERLNFRHKKFGWRKFSLCLQFSKQRLYLCKNDIDCYMNLFLDNVCSREACYRCHFKGINRASDFTMGDLWGADVIIPEIDDDKGISLVFNHTKKAEYIFEKISEKNICRRLSDTQIKTAITINSFMIESAIRPKSRDELKFYLKDFKIFEKYNERSHCTVGILNHAFSNSNYGALLVAFAMEKIVTEYGYTPLTIYLNLDKNYTPAFDDFRKKYLHTTKPLKLRNINKLNEMADTFIIGSDQVWRNWWKNFDIFKIWFGSFANYQKKIIAYGASFGVVDFPENEIDKAKIKNLLSAFSAISVRESSGVDILKNNFGLYSDLVLDPTLLIHRSYYETLLKDMIAQYKEPFITAMLFPCESSDTLETHNALKTLSKCLNLELKYIFNGNRQLSIPEWLYYISKSELNIIDSFHGLMFSLIFHKNFVCISNSEGGNERFSNILNLCGLEDKFIDCKAVNYELLKKKAEIKVDWDGVERRISRERKKSREFIESALTKDVNYNSKVLYAENLKSVLKRKTKSGRRILKMIIKKITICVSSRRRKHEGGGLFVM